METVSTLLMKPFEACIVAVKLFQMGKEWNVTHQGKPASGVKQAAFS